MPQASGVVQYINDKNTKVGVTYNVRLEGDDKYYGTYKTNPTAKFKVGDYVEFDYSTKGDFHNVDWKSVEVTENEAVQSSTGASEGVSDKAKAAFDKAAGREAQTRWHAARASAIELARVAAEAGCLDIGTGNKEGKYEALQIFVNAQTLEYFNEGSEVAATGTCPEAYKS